MYYIFQQLIKTSPPIGYLYYERDRVINVKTINNYAINFGWLVYGVNATFNNISVISWQSVLLVEETGVPKENRRSAIGH